MMIDVAYETSTFCNNPSFLQMLLTSTWYWAYCLADTTGKQHTCDVNMIVYMCYNGIQEIAFLVICISAFSELLQVSLWWNVSVFWLRFNFNMGLCRCACVDILMLLYICVTFFTRLNNSWWIANSNFH